MKLLFDQNLSFKLCDRLADLFPQSAHVRLLGLAEAGDITIWEHAKSGGYVLVTQDAYFGDLAAHYGAPPKVIWLRCGNQPTEVIELLLRQHLEAITAFESDATAACLEIG
jgi:predicted nuclease of predicted toxin-antitoxin system